MIAIKQVCSETNIKKFVWGKTIWRNLQVQYVRGGVARNVAESMAQLGTCPLLISVVGEDFAGDSLLGHWKSLGLSIAGQCQVFPPPL
jgi:sugar/nucleoside kinase (ribokinase family)